MFRKLKRLYFKFYHLLKFLGVFVLALIVLMPSVKAEECINLYNYEPGDYSRIYNEGVNNIANLYDDWNITNGKTYTFFSTLNGEIVNTPANSSHFVNFSCNFNVLRNNFFIAETCDRNFFSVNDR